MPHPYIILSKASKILALLVKDWARDFASAPLQDPSCEDEVSYWNLGCQWKWRGCWGERWLACPSNFKNSSCICGHEECTLQIYGLHSAKCKVYSSRHFDGVITSHKPKAPETSSPYSQWFVFAPHPMLVKACFYELRLLACRRDSGALQSSGGAVWSSKTRRTRVGTRGEVAWGVGEFAGWKRGTSCWDGGVVRRCLTDFECRYSITSTQ